MFDSWEIFWKGKPGAPWYDPWNWFTPETGSGLGTRPGTGARAVPADPGPLREAYERFIVEPERREQQRIAPLIYGAAALVIFIIYLIFKKPRKK